MNLFRPAFILALATALPACAAPPPAADNTHTDARTRGAQVFADSGCPQCHTIRHTGGTKGPDLSGVGRRLNESQLRNQILQGGKQMPSFSDALQAAETDDLVAYLHSCRDKSKKPK